MLSIKQGQCRALPFGDGQHVRNQFLLMRSRAPFGPVGTVLDAHVTWNRVCSPAEPRRVPVAATVTEWEQAVIDRSEFEALHTPPERLIADEKNVGRYLNPRRDTAYPLEYAFALRGDVAGRTILDFGCGSGENSLLLA